MGFPYEGEDSVFVNEHHAKLGSFPFNGFPL